MFIKKEEYLKLQQLNVDLKIESERLRNKIEKLEVEKQGIKQDLEEEHLENYKQHKKLLAIEKLLNLTFGSYKELLKFRNKVQNIIKNELADTNLTNSNH